MSIATTIALAVVRGPVPLAKCLAAIDLLSGGRLMVGVGPGSYRRPAERCAERLTKYAQAGVDRVFLWPVGEPIEQLEAFGERGGAAPPRLIPPNPGCDSLAK